ncbi:hypothetical protein JCM11251_005786 [Rhodosporidiobolus azoricus]
MHCSLSTTLLALVATSASVASASPHDFALHPRANRGSACAPAMSEFLFNIVANKVESIAVKAHNKQITKVDTRFAIERGQEKGLMWNLEKLDNGNYQIQTADGETCLRARGEGVNVAAYTCDEKAADYNITCNTCSTSSCGEPVSTGCTIQSVAVKGQCITRKDGKLVSSKCSGSKAQLWDFTLA